ncbi:MAG: diguanylate cyclase [Planctomycetes bacterium]|nr:diguanylate cyclase [Planctomycetota bacterium]
MLSEDPLHQIIRICLAIDQRADMVYARFAETEEDPGLKRFWQEMSEEEKKHVELWRRLLDMARDQILPQVFDHPESVVAALEVTHDKVNEMAKDCLASRDRSCAFLLAYRMEFYMMRHPAFAMLLHYIQTVTEEKNIEDEYDRHIDAFVEAFGKYGEVTPELELLGETVRYLWQENRMLARQSTTDALTGVLNRRGFFNAMKPLAHLAHREGAPVGVLMVDIDDFKQINDTLGHQKGDEMLRMLGSILRDRTRVSDLVGRYGGEEFIVFLPLIAKDSAYRIAEGIRERVESETKDNTPITVSIGVAEGMLEDNVDQDAFEHIKKADARLYEAKRCGKNIVVMEEA